MALWKDGDCIMNSYQALQIPAWFKPVFSECDILKKRRKTTGGRVERIVFYGVSALALQAARMAWWVVG